MIQVAYVVFWWLALEIIGLVSFPLVSRICNGLGDRGYSISKLVGLVLLTYSAWILSTLHILPFGIASIAVSFLLLAVLSLFLGRSNLRIPNWPRRQIIISDSLFTISFIVFVLIMLGNPDIYFTGASDSVFNYAFLQSILRADYFPPIDPWFAGESIQYYYGGHLLTALLTVVTRVPPTIAFNIAGAMFLALAVSASYGLGYNITRRKLYGFVTAFFICLVGYTSGALQLIAFVSHHEIMGYAPSNAATIIDWLLWFNFSQAPWHIEGAIVHYPYFSFVMGDMHSYSMSLPFQPMFILLIFAMLQKGRLVDEPAGSDTLLDISVLGLCLGFFAILNTWEYPTYIIFTVVAFILLRIRPSVRGNLIVPAAIIGLSFLLYLPHYISGSISNLGGLGLVTTRTSLAQFLEFSALFLFASASLLFMVAKRDVLRGRKALLAAAIILTVTVVAAILLDFQLLIIVVPMGLLSLYYIYISSPRSVGGFVVLLLLMSAAMIFFCDFLYINDSLSTPWERFNTVMKVYLQLWVFLGTAAAYAIFYMMTIMGRKTKIVWVAMVGILIVASLIHPLASTTSMLSGRNTYWGLNRGTLDGMAYLEMVDKGDHDAIRWIQTEIEGTPVLLEVPGNPSIYSSRISAFTGLPTVIGWQLWEIMWGHPWDEVDRRARDVDMIYDTLDNDQALELLRTYDVEYIYIGTLEREQYEDEGLGKFASQANDYELVYEGEGVTIFRVRDE
ncbi:MAG: DUF2298 domain-containing protein [Chloroflexota bacterium]|nr:DUF2298 domain-containing protein [Chloroflexota bacterium]